MNSRDDLGKGMTKEEVEGHLRRVFQRGKEVQSLVDQAKEARLRLLEKIISQNLDGQLVAESVARMENALRIGFDPSDTKWPPPVVTVYLEPHQMLGHASILVDELFLDGQKTTKWDQELSTVNQLLIGRCQKHEPLLSRISGSLDELLKQVERTLSRIQEKMGLDAKDFEEQTWWDYADYVLPARDEIEYGWEGLCMEGFQGRFVKFRDRLISFDERLRKALPEAAKKYHKASGRYYLTGGDLETSPMSFWWRRLGLTRKGEPVWR